MSLSKDELVNMLINCNNIINSQLTNGKLPRILTKNEILSYNDYLTVGKCKEMLANCSLSDDAIVVVQRVEDKYYENHSWGVYLEDEQDSYSMKKFNDDLRSGKFADNYEAYPHLTNKELREFTEVEIQHAQWQYHPVFSAWAKPGETDVLFLDMHY